MKPTDLDTQTVFQGRPRNPEAFSIPDRGSELMPTAGYELGDVIGKGGMGEVFNALDRRMGREVALKRLGANRPTGDEMSRFLREARIQARLEHPAIVPIHELGVDDQGRPYFTMKRITGQTLREVAPSATGNQRLLRAFADVCLAVEYAHARGVVHRDLKPSNIMLGDFGEVYILDWGLARLVGDPDSIVQTADVDIFEASSEPSQLRGTPGYIAPEQLHISGNVGRPVDVYALGAILFEIVARHSVHPRQAELAIASTLSRATVVSPAQRFPELGIPVELDELCAAALALDATVRPTAAQLADAVHAYLDGDRDIAHRKAVATEQLWRARASLVGGSRADAMQSAGRALALDPENASAAELVTALMLEPPKLPPPGLARALRDADAENLRRHARMAVLAYAVLVAFLPLTGWFTVVPAVICGLTIAVIARANRRAQHQLVIQAWHLRQLLPVTTSPS